MNKIIYTVSLIVYCYTSSKLYIFSYIIYFIIIYLPYIRLYGHYSQVFSSVTVTTCFNNLGLSRLGFEHSTFRIQGEYVNQLSHLCGMKVGSHLHVHINETVLYSVPAIEVILKINPILVNINMQDSILVI